MKKIVTIGVLLLFAMMLIAQGGKESEIGKKTIVTLDILGTDVQKSLLDKWIPVFMAENPDIQVEYKVLDWATGETKILTSIAGGMGADIIMVYGADVPQWIEQGALSPIDEYFSKDAFYETAYNLGKWNNSLYAVPWVTKITSYYYRIDKYKEAGLDPTNPPKTWDELIQHSTALTKRDNQGNLTQNGTWITTSHPWKTVSQFAAYLWSAGGSFFNEDGTKAVLNNAIGVETANFLRDLLHVYKVDEPGSILNEEIDFAQGKMASGVCNNGPRGIANNNPEMLKNVVIALPPTKDGSTQAYAELGGDYLGITPTAKNRDAAAKLVKFLTHTPEIVVEMCARSFGPPALKDAAEPFSKYVPFADDWYAMASSATKFQPLHPRWSEIQAILTNALDLVYLNKNSNTQQIFDQAVVKINQILLESGPASGE